MRRYFLLLVTALFSLGSKAVPARPLPMTVLQKDRTTVTVYLRGDEHYHYFLTDDGVPIMQGEDLSYYYALSGDSTLTVSNLLAHNAEERNEEETALVAQHKGKALEIIAKQCETLHRMQEDDGNHPMRIRAKSLVQRALAYQGSKKGLVILVNFTDCSMSGTDPNVTFTEMFNKEGYNENYHIGSVHDYFFDQSYGQFDLTFDVVGPVTVSEKMSYYGANNHYDLDAHPGEMVIEACRLVDDLVDFADYDWDGDGEVDQVFVIYAGYGENAGAPSYTIWPHEYNLSSAAAYGDGEGIICLDGVNINTYACTAELTGTTGTTPDGIGTACHEFSHCLGLPDFYDVNYGGGFGMDSWDVMDMGCYNGPNGNSEIPCGYTAYERWYCGWMSLTELSGMTRVKDMPCLGDEPVAYKISNDNYPDEYLLLENRQNEGWFTYVKQYSDCHGLLVTHVDYSPMYWYANIVNTLAKHQRMSIIPADNGYGSQYTNSSGVQYSTTENDLKGDPFPGNSKVTELTNTSHLSVGGEWFNTDDEGNYYIDKPLTNIKDNKGLVSFDFMGGIYVPTPVLNEAEVLGEHSFRITWETEEDVDSFTVEAKEIKDKSALTSILLSENCSTFVSDSIYGDGVMDVSIYMDSYTQTSGWSGEKIYTSQYGAKIGKAGYTGRLQTPLLSLSAGSLTLKLGLLATDSTATPMQVSIISLTSDTICSCFVNGTESASDYVLNFEDITENECYVCLICRSPYYMTSFTAYDGVFSAEDISSSSGLGSILGSIITPAETITVSGVCEKSYTFSNLSASHYKYRVRAIYDEALSEWSDYKEVDCMSSDKVSSIEANGKETIRIYNMNGQRIGSGKLKGTYIIDYGTHKKKVIMR
ncbi:MAG: M6 family metalloprotease domain-containing protein [Prevotellaceae bacterium]|nr:M6 family metalloprotease domain-containing protein [Prevotellaceae bacterium]